MRYACDLSVMKGRCFVDLLFDEVECVHRRSPKGWDFCPVPSVVCVPEGMNDPFRDLLASHEWDERRVIIPLIDYIVKQFCNL